MRLRDWEARLSAFLAERRDMPFAWGSMDCALFATAAAAAQTGDDRAAEYRGTYTDRKGSAAALRCLGKGTLLRTMDSLFPRCPPAFARRGDLVWFKGSVGVCVGGEALFVGEVRVAKAAGVMLREGLIAVPRGEWTRAWRV
ncbi:MAG: hypothetical protein V4696_10665 [Pseudomonadota bacterium]